MKKRVFKVVGIVLAVVLAFIGIVIGVMAIQGKFKKQIVYPKDLVFENTGYVEINDDSPTSTHLHSFTLTGTNGSKTVNRKTCYIRFVDSYMNEPVFGNELITLCDKNFQPLNIETEGNFAGYYKINCNEPVYYCFKPDDATSAHYARPNYGRVVLEANDQTGMVKSNQLVFDVDRVVDEIKFQDATYTLQTDALTQRQYGYQEKTLRLGNSFMFNFEVAPSYSLHPFSNKLESKVVEFYYVENDPSSGTMLEYRPINSAFANEVDFLTEEGGLFRFTPTEVGHYQFVYAVFDSFEHETNAPEEEFYYQRVQKNMVYSVLDIAVTSETATSLEISESANLNFKLYETDSMVLNSNSAGVRNNLKLKINDGNISELYNTFEFNTSLGRNWSNTNIVFKSEDDSVSLTNCQKIGDSLRIAGQDYAIHYGNINLQAGRLIESLTRDGKTYKATTGVAFIDNSGRVSLLSVGSYLDFVEKNDAGYQIADLRYEAQFSSRQFANSTCEIKILSVPQIAEGGALHLMALIVNADGSYVVASNECNISVSPLEYTIHQSVQLDVTYPNGIAHYGSKNFEDIVEISGGTYTAGLLVTEQSDDGYSIDVLENCTYTINDTTYVLVGYIGNGGFVNAVRARNLAKSSTTIVYLMQIKNAYLQSAEEFVNSKIENGEEGGFTFETSEVAAVYTQHQIEVENNYELRDNLAYNFNETTEYESGEQGKDQYIKKDGNFYRILENTNGHKITVSSPIENMLSNITGKLSPSNFGCFTFVTGQYQPANSALTVNAVEIVDGVMTITFQANSFDRISGKFVLGFEYAGKYYYTPEIQLDSQAAQGIMFVYDGSETTLPTAENAADIPTINVTITGFNGDGYSFEYKYNGQTIEDLNALFNSTFTKNAAGPYGFVPIPAYGVNNKQYSFVYDPLDKSILTITQTGEVQINILKVGSGIIRVSCNSTEAFGYIKIEITPSPDFVFQPKEAENDDIDVTIKDNSAEVATNSNSLYLDSFVNYSLGGVGQTNANYFQISTVRCSIINDEVTPKEDGSFEIKDTAGNTYATISIKEGRWSIERTRTHSSFNLSFDVSVATAEKALSINIQFNSAVSVELNSNYNATIYASTKVLLAELINTSATGTTQKFTNNSLFRISKTSAALNYFRITYKKYQTEGNGDNETEVAGYFNSIAEDKTVSISDPGYYVFTIYIASNESGENADSVTFILIVKPNVVFSQDAQNEEKAHTLVSADEVDLSRIVTLRKYKTDTDVIYGKGDDSKAPYDDANLTSFETSDYSSLQLENNLYEYEKNKNANILTLTEDKTKVKTLWLTDLDEVVNAEIKLIYGTTEFDLPVHIVNKYKPETSGTAFEFSARNFATAPVSIVDNNSEPAGATLSSVTGQDFDFEVDETTHKFKLNQDLEERVSAALTFTFNISISGENHTLIYKNTGNTNVPNVSITLTPRTPKPKTAINPISNSTFDIINDVFEINEKEDGDGIESIEVVAVTNIQIYATKVVGVKYIYGQPDNTTITFAEISGDEQTSTITYQITYTGGIVHYNHDVTFTVKNRQTIEINYPYQDENFETHTANDLIPLDTDDAATIDHINRIKNSFKYEPVNSHQTITFGAGSRRVEISENGEKKENEIKSVEWVACTNAQQNIHVSISQDGNNFNVTFSLELNTTSAFVVLKITSNSGNYKFYNIRIYNQTTNPGTANVDSTNTWQINFDGTKGNSFYSHEGNTYKILGETFGTEQLSQFFKLQGAQPNDKNFKLYLLEASIMSDEELDAYSTLGLNQFKLLNNKTLTTLPQFATLKIALIHFGNSADAIVYLGNIEVYAQSNKGVSLKQAEGNAPSISNKIANINNGEYVCTWMMSSSSTFSIPFKFADVAHTGLTLEILSADGFVVSGDEISFNGTKIISISQTDGTITRENFVKRAYSFEVKYIFTFADNSKLVLLVTFKMEQTNVPTGNQNYSVGYDVTRQAFVKTQEIDLWGYTGKLKLYVDGSEESIDIITGGGNKELSGSTVTATYEGGILTLTFVLSTEAYEFRLGIEYSGIIGASLNYSVTIAVDSSAYVYFPLSAQGSSVSLPSTANINDDAYSSADASSIQIVSNMDVDKNINTFSIENTVALNELKIFTEGSTATLEVEYSQPEFVTLKYGAEGNAENKIGFAHSARNDVVVELIIKIKSGDAYFEDSTNEAKTVHLFIKVPQTYTGLEAMYLTAGADHENVLSDQTIIAIRSDLFGAISQTDSDVASEKIYNGSKIAMIDIDGNRITKDLTALGFKDRDNANYIEIEPHTDQLVKEFTVNDTDANDNDLKFPAISNNTNTTISLSNKAGITNLSYKYQIMKDIKVGEDNVKLLDGATPNDAPKNEYIFSATYSGETQKTQTIDYSFIVNKDEATDKLSISELKIATLLDESNTAFYIKAIDAKAGESALSASVKNRSPENNEIKYTLEYTNYTLTITRTAHMEIAVELTEKDTSTSTDEILTFDITLVGNGGDYKLCLNIYNCTLTTPDAQTQTAGFDVAINFGEIIKSNVEGGTAFDDVTFAYEQNGTYVNYKRDKIEKLSANNKYFSFEISEDKNKGTVHLYTIAENATINIRFKVILGEKIIGYVDQFIEDNCDYVYVLQDGSSIISNSASYAETYYLWLKSPYKDEEGARVFDKSVTLMGSQNEQPDQYNLNDQRYNDRINITLRNRDSVVGVSSIKITLVDESGEDLPSPYCTIEKGDTTISLKFQKDFTGKVILKLSATTNNGPFEQYLALDILGYVTLKYSNNNTEDSILSTTGGNGYESGTEVRLIDTSAVDKTTGLVISTTKHDDDDNKDGEELYEGVTPVVSYVILPYQSSLHIAEAYAEAANAGRAINLEIGESVLSINNDTFTLKHNLPTVPMSTQDNYVVIYCVQLTYFGLDTNTMDKYYVAYKVHNDVKLTPKGTPVDADTDLAEKSLKLFQYTVTYAVDGKNYVVYSAIDGTIHLKDEEANEYTVQGNINGKEITFVDKSNNTIKISDVSIERPSITITEHDQQPKTLNATRTISNGAADANIFFRLGYGSILEFKDFITNSYIRLDADQNSNYVGAGNKVANLDKDTDYLYYQLTSLGDGVFGINLIEPYKSASFVEGNKLTLTDGKLFNNEFNCTLNVMDKTSNDSILKTSLTITTTNALTASGYTLNEMFKTTLPEAENFRIIGIGNAPSANWVAQATKVDGEKEGELAVGSLVTTVKYMNTNYEIYSATWSGTSDGIYMLSQVFYYIKTEATSIVTVNFDSGDSTLFIVENRDSKITTDNKICVYKNKESGGGLEMTYEKATAFATDETENNIYKENNTYVTFTDGQLSIAPEKLTEYQTAHPGEDFLTIQCTLTYNGTSFTVKIQFQLPDVQA